MTLAVKEFAAIALASGTINQKILNGPDWSNRIGSGIFGGMLVTPVFFANEALKNSRKKLSIKNLFEFTVANRGNLWNQYATLQGRLAFRGAGFGVALVLADVLFSTELQTKLE
jgi:hypothetical protein